MINNSIVIDGCVFCEDKFEGISKQVMDSSLDLFFLTVPKEFEGFTECVTEIGRIYNMCDSKEKKLQVINNYDEIDKLVKNKEKGIILTFQDPYSIGNSLDRLRVFYELGLRVFQMTYNKMNYIGTGCLESQDIGLTDFGKDIVKELNKLGIIIDLSHSSRKTTLDTFKISENPVVFSHAGSKTLTDNPRNKTDEELKLLKENGGVIGLSPWGPLCWDKKKKVRPNLEDFINHIEYVVDLIGIDHVAFGGDSTLDDNEDKKGIEEQSSKYAPVVEEYNKFVGVDPEVRHAKGIKGVWEIENVVESLKSRGYNEEDISKFLGGNFLRVMKEVWKI